MVSRPISIRFKSEEDLENIKSGAKTSKFRTFTGFCLDKLINGYTIDEVEEFLLYIDEMARTLAGYYREIVTNGIDGMPVLDMDRLKKILEIKEEHIKKIKEIKENRQLS